MAGEEKFGYFRLGEGTEGEDGSLSSGCGWLEVLCVWRWELVTDCSSFVCEKSGKVVSCYRSGGRWWRGCTQRLSTVTSGCKHFASGQKQTDLSCDNSPPLPQGFWLATGVFVKERAEGLTCPLLSCCSLECLPIPCTLPSRPPSSMRWRNGVPKSIRASKWGEFNQFMPVPMFSCLVYKSISLLTKISIFWLGMFWSMAIGLNWFKLVLSWS